MLYENVSFYVHILFNDIHTKSEDRFIINYYLLICTYPKSAIIVYFYLRQDFGFAEQTSCSKVTCFCIWLNCCGVSPVLMRSSGLMLSLSRKPGVCKHNTFFTHYNLILDCNLSFLHTAYSLQSHLIKYVAISSKNNQIQTIIQMELLHYCNASPYTPDSVGFV